MDLEDGAFLSVEELAIDSDGFTALTCEDGLLRVYNPAGALAGEFRGARFRPRPPDRRAEGSSVAWLTLTRRGQVLRGHDRSGRVAWESPVPWEAWQFLAVGNSAVAVAPDGRVMAYDPSGHALAQGRADGVPGRLLPRTQRPAAPGRAPGGPPHLLGPGREGDLEGRRRCAARSPGDGEIGPGRADRQITRVVFELRPWLNRKDDERPRFAPHLVDFFGI